MELKIDDTKKTWQWDQLAKPPADALRPIAGGRLKGKTDINPQWRLKAMHEQFGAVGHGWTYTIDKVWTEKGASVRNDKGSDDLVMCFVQVSVKTKVDGEWGEPVPGIGGSMLVEKEVGGAYTNDEGYKMALTDALSVALKAHGVAAAIYMGLWDGAKYKDGAINAPPAKYIIDRINKATLEDLESIASEIKGVYHGNDRDAIAKAYKDRLEAVK
jgi:hypothetical protein